MKKIINITFDKINTTLILKYLFLQNVTFILERIE